MKRLAGRAADEILETVRFVAGVAAVWLGLVTFGFAAFHIPSESMQPSLEVGDRVLVSKWAYGYSVHSLPLGLGYALPDSWNGRLAWSQPRRGDVVVFRDENQTPARNLIKRVVGVAGDVIEVREGRLYINEEVVPRMLEDVRIYREDRSGVAVTVSHYTEVLPGDRDHEIYEQNDNDMLDNFGPVTVRPGTVFVMGDNRDASRDSRASGGPGFVPLENVVGRAETVLFTLERCRREQGLHCPSGRVWRGL
ncbi:signal peptidase I [Maricaulis maris]|uniref:Signal peptidase I n=1 Tax=Maricaulis maris TaxID=74318 RepID=A0A495D0S4_9PROT|nr:signal peptidase I [Maricaulis maris]RKQ95155.1 signal peptidase I [Maricaulis maris]